MFYAPEPQYRPTGSKPRLKICCPIINYLIILLLLYYIGIFKNFI